MFPRVFARWRAEPISCGSDNYCDDGMNRLKPVVGQAKRRPRALSILRGNDSTLTAAAPLDAPPRAGDGRSKSLCKSLCWLERSVPPSVLRGSRYPVVPRIRPADHARDSNNDSGHDDGYDNGNGGDSVNESDATATTTATSEQ